MRTSLRQDSGRRFTSGTSEAFERGAWRQACYSPARGLALVSACPNKIHPPQTSSIFICHTSVNMRSYECGCLCPEDTVFLLPELVLKRIFLPLIALCFFFIRLMKPCKFQTLVSNCATAWATRGTFTSLWFVGDLTCTGIFIFPFPLWPHMVSSGEWWKCNYVLLHQIKLIKVIEWLLYLTVACVFPKSTVL